ncbi:MAG: Cell division protein FtsI (Peptidoglycan synthetase) [Thermocaproicibacter melissae]|jgi:penicillin-binding protein A|uniref:penicillin-binding transpeptidase domain-containing protein n=1 Tax=Thermocaproicibacter melissae TaxID=2966552 RepID=UPI0024B22B29|nr:penicillin-binding transpeptidase domain-containing protein [Thermocaproicibacter melissae]WBY64352.1 penicillin-binding transpeptidase domain-containing protein [Thermocaproicibacter melissae]
MKTTGARSLILFLLAAGFFFGMGVFLYGLVTEGGKWAVQPFNGHISGNSVSSSEGSIYDRDGNVIAQTKGGKRVYSSDVSTRRALLHVVGDTDGNISTGVQYCYRSELSGYNFITGLVSPTGKTNGCSIHLTIDSDLCRLAREKLNGRNGAAALYNYKTGELLCMVSTPDFDPENPPKDIATNESYSGAYLNKVLSSTFTPGSVFKLVTSAAAIENFPDLDSRTWACNGSVIINGNKITDMGSYGTLNFKKALAKSSNVAFAQIAVELGASKMTAAANKMGFNSSFSLDGIPTAAGSYDVSGASADELGWSGVGQYTDLANPFHLLVLMGAIANGGTPVMPYMVQSVVSPVGIPVKVGTAQTGNEMVSPTTAARLREYMRYNVTDSYGDDLFPGMNVCAKTGTAEVGGGKKPNCWMVGYSTNNSTPYAFVVLVEDSSQTSVASAGRIASALMKKAASIK